MVVTLPYW